MQTRVAAHLTEYKFARKIEASMKKDKKHEEDTDYKDEMGGGEGKEKPLTKEGFLGVLRKVSRPVKKSSRGKGSSKTSE